MMPGSTSELLLLRQEVAALHEMDEKKTVQIEAMSARIKVLTEENERLRQHNHVMKLKVDALARRLFGKSSERLDPAQLQMVFEALEREGEGAKKPEASCAREGSEADEEPEEEQADSSNGSTTAPRKKRSLEQLIKGLPVTEVIVDPEEVKADPAAWDCIGAEVTKLVDYTPGKFSAQHIIRRKYVRREERHLPPVIAPAQQLQPRCIASPRLLAHLVSSRFEMHLPYYRIEQMYARAGMPISRQTLCGWAGMSSDASRLVIEAIKAEVFADGYVQIDETPVKYQDPGREGVCGTGYLWSIYNPVRRIGFMAWHTGRGAVCLEQIVPRDYVGLIQCDGFSAYESFIKSPARSGNIQLAGCMAHARRKFFEAKDESEDARWVLAQMQQLYRIEAEMREARAGPHEVRARRQQQSIPILEAIKSRLQSLQASRKHLPRSLTGGAIAYTLGQWDKLCVFTRDGRVQIDNNLVENSIRPSAIGKKNWLFMGDAGTGDRAATFYTLIANCHSVGLNAESYLTELFERLPSATTKTVHELTPHAIAAKRRAEVQAAAQEVRESRLTTA
jgi:transposase